MLQFVYNFAHGDFTLLLCARQWIDNGQLVSIVYVDLCMFTHYKQTVHSLNSVTNILISNI